MSEPTTLPASTDPICGACRNPRSLHHEERHGITDYVFCNLETTGDVFTDEPRDSDLMDLLARERPEVLDEMLHMWRVRNGHEEVEHDLSRPRIMLDSIVASPGDGWTVTVITQSQQLVFCWRCATRPEGEDGEDDEDDASVWVCQVARWLDHPPEYHSTDPMTLIAAHRAVTDLLIRLAEVSS